MTPAEPFLTLQHALEAYFEAIALQREANPPPLIPHFEKLDAWQAHWEGEAPPQLRHYLQKKSYQKALAYLRGEEKEEG